MFKYIGEKYTDAYAQHVSNLIEMAKKLDKEYSIFGASSHRYNLNPTIQLQDIKKLEEKFEIELPESYKFFLTQIGNGGAGPYYGIDRIEDITENNQYMGSVKNSELINDSLTDEKWAHIVDLMDDDALYERGMEQIHGGMLIIGTQGCTYDILLMLSGSQKGNIVYIDWNLEENSKPFFTNMNFLEWYEKYFEEIATGNSVSGYGYVRLDSEENLICKYNISNLKEKKEILYSLHRFSKLKESTIQLLADIKQGGFDDLRIQILLKHDVTRALKLFDKLIKSKNIPMINRCLRAIPAEIKDQYYNHILEMVYIKDDCSKEPLLYNLMKCTEFLGKDVVEFAMDETRKEACRKTAIWALGSASDSMSYLENFIDLMHSESYWIAHSALQAVSRKPDVQLVDTYKWMLEKYKSDKTMYSNLKIAFETNHINIESL